MKVLLDTNVILDVLQKRSPWFEDGKEIFLAVAAKQIDGFITAKEAADIHFFSRKQFKGEDNIDTKVRKIISGLLALLESLILWVKTVRMLSESKTTITKTQS